MRPEKSGNCRPKAVDNVPRDHPDSGSVGAMTTHPQLRPHLPILDRGQDELQIGADHGLILHRTGRREHRALALMDGHHSATAIATGSGLSHAEVMWLIDRLAEAGLLVTEQPDPRRPLIRLLGAGMLARTFAEAYTDARMGDLLLIEPEPTPPGLYNHLRASGAESLRAHLAGRSDGAVRTGSHWYRPESPTPTLTVIAYDRLECDRAITDTLLRNDQPHLFLRPLADGVIVGPFVVPGQTCCTRCMDLLRVRDRAWSRLLVQLCRTTRVVDEHLAGWAATTALLQVRAWLAGHQPESLGATLEVRTGEWILHQRHWPRHPDCGCIALSLGA